MTPEYILKLVADIIINMDYNGIINMECEIVRESQPIIHLDTVLCENRLSKISGDSLFEKFKKEFESHNEQIIDNKLENIIRQFNKNRDSNNC